MKINFGFLSLIFSIMNLGLLLVIFRFLPGGFFLELGLIIFLIIEFLSIFLWLMAIIYEKDIKSRQKMGWVGLIISIISLVIFGIPFYWLSGIH